MHNSNRFLRKLFRKFHLLEFFTKPKLINRYGFELYPQPSEKQSAREQGAIPDLRFYMFNGKRFKKKEGC